MVFVNPFWKGYKAKRLKKIVMLEDLYSLTFLFPKLDDRVTLQTQAQLWGQLAVELHEGSTGLRLPCEHIHWCCWYKCWCDGWNPKRLSINKRRPPLLTIHLYVYLVDSVSKGRPSLLALWCYTPSRPLRDEITRRDEIGAPSVCVVDCIHAHGSDPARSSGPVSVLWELIPDVLFVWS